MILSKWVILLIFCFFTSFMGGCSQKDTRKNADINPKLSIANAVDESTLIVVANLASKEISFNLPKNKEKNNRFGKFSIEKFLYGKCKKRNINLSYEYNEGIDIPPAKNEKLIIFIKVKFGEFSNTLSVIKIMSYKNVDLAKLKRLIYSKQTTVVAKKHQKKTRPIVNLINKYYVIDANLPPKKIQATLNGKIVHFPLVLQADNKTLDCKFNDTKDALIVEGKGEIKFNISDSQKLSCKKLAKGIGTKNSIEYYYYLYYVITIENTKSKKICLDREGIIKLINQTISTPPKKEEKPNN